MAKIRRGYRILVVEDSEEQARMLGEMLDRMGYPSVVCTRPVEALTLFAESSQEFDCVILDEMMPQLRGTELAPRLLRIDHDVPIILLTGHGEKLSLADVRRSGVRATLMKPLLRQELQSALDRVFPIRAPGR